MRNQKGITLIALVITIIVLLILAGVTIAMLSGENGILSRATTTKEANAEAQAREQSNLAYMSVRTAIAAEKTKDGNFKPNGTTAATYGGTSQTPHAYLTELCRKDCSTSEGWTVKDNTDNITLEFVNDALKQTDHKLIYTIDLTKNPVEIKLTTPASGKYNQI